MHAPRSPAMQRSDRRESSARDEAARRWAACGAMALTGEADGAPSVAPASLALTADRTAERIASSAAQRGVALALDGAALLGERAAIAGLARRGCISAGGSARILRAADGWIALNLPRRDDRAALPAWLECDAIDANDPWPALGRALREREVAALVERAALLGLAVADAGAQKAALPPGVRRVACGAKRLLDGVPLVVDLASLWAGPLCASLLGAAGARVVKGESRTRPDGARFGPPAFFDLLNAGKRSVALEWATPDGVSTLRRLIAAADVVVESARPRALAQLGIDAEHEVAARPGLVWVSITGYGRASERVAFGDDAACAAGLAWLAGRDAGAPLFCADAVADPLAGLRAAEAALDALAEGGGLLLDVSLAGVAAEAIAASDAPVRWDGRVAPPRARRPPAAARPLGADTRAVLGALGARAG